MADDEKVFGLVAFAQKLLKVFESGGWSEGGGGLDLGFVAGFGSDEGCGLETAFEGAGDDQVKLDVQRIEHVSELEAVLFAFFVERTFGVEQWIWAS